MINRKIFGDKGEIIASNFLKNKGYKIICRNYLCRSGEIDIIAQDIDTIVFVEVKTRKNSTYGRGTEAVDEIKQKKIIRTALIFLYANNLLDIKARFDVIEIIYYKNKYYINHLKDIINETNV